MIYDINNSDSILRASEILKKGGIIIYPTDTLYGLGVDATNTVAVNKLNNLKKRKQAYSVIVDSENMLKEYAIIPENRKDVLNKYFPGPFTIIFSKKDNNLSKLIYQGYKTIGIRIPKHEFPIKLVKLLNCPIVTTSVNIHNKKPIFDINKIENTFKGLDVFVDNNIIKNSLGSTIIDFSVTPNKILRKGDGFYKI